MSKFNNAIAIVTGAGSGIGEATAKKMASEGAKVVLVGRTLEKLERVAKEINDEEGVGTAYSFSADVTNEEDVRQLVEYTRNNVGEITLLVNNAGRSDHANIQNTSFETWKAIQEVNNDSVFLVSKIVGEAMIEAAEENPNENRSIVNVASLSGHKPGAMIPDYSAAKAAVLNFTKALAFEYSRSNIRVNSVSPGFIETPMTETSLENERFQKAVERNTTMGRVGRPEEIANAISFLLSEDASYVTGTDLLVDGGFLLT